ncbi:hypothetical protein [Crenothrix sp.]|uniref:hypothetical protein n=1 Tax=Crenothrix sp. TaxID=3100433 RepID=UPI00374CA97D
MTTETIIESGMSFGPFSDGHCFYIEKSQTLKDINKHEGIRIAEFLLLNTENNRTVVSIVEAKTSSPQPKSHENYASYINEIKEKLTNSLALFVSFNLQRYPAGHAELPDNFKQLQIANIHFELILVVKNSKSEWLIPLSDDLKKALKPTVKIWNLSPTSVKVFNEEEAKVKKLVS